MKRREAREQAFILLFEKTFTEETLDTIVSNAAMGRNIEIDHFAYKLATGVLENLPLLDEQISKYLKKWKLNRIPRVSLSILRLCFYEISFMDDIPVSVSINEAVELAKTYAEDDAPAFINGVLGSFVRELDPEKEKELALGEESELV